MHSGIRVSASASAGAESSLTEGGFYPRAFNARLKFTTRLLRVRMVSNQSSCLFCPMVEYEA